MRFQSVVPRLPVADLSRAIAFYTDVLEFTLDGVWPEAAPTFAILWRDDVSLQFYVPEAAAPPRAAPPAIINFNVDDAAAMHRALSGRVKIEWGPKVYWYGRREFAICDPDGYMLIFSEETSDPPTCVEE